MNERTPRRQPSEHVDDARPVDPAARLLGLVGGADVATLAASLSTAADAREIRVLARSLELADDPPAGSGAHSLRDAAAAFGRDEAAAGARPCEVVRAVSSALGQLRVSHRAGLDITELHKVALASWAEQHARMAQLDQCLDAFTGLHTGAYLRTRLAQLYAQCPPLGIRPAAVWALLPIRLVAADPTPLAALGALDALVGHLHREFAAGETVAALDRSNCVALVPAQAVAEIAVSLELALALDPALTGVGWTVLQVPLTERLTDTLAVVDGLVR